MIDEVEKPRKDKKLSWKKTKASGRLIIGFPCIRKMKYREKSWRKKYIWRKKITPKGR